MSGKTVENVAIWMGLAGLLGVLFMGPIIGSRHPGNHFDRIAEALEAYALDNGGAYPDSTVSRPFPWHSPMISILTTPIAYLQKSDVLDPYAKGSIYGSYLRYINIETQFGPGHPHYAYMKARHGSWIVWSGNGTVENLESGVPFDLLRYDPTNGTQTRNATYRPMTHSFRSQRMRSETGAE